MYILDEIKLSNQNLPEVSNDKIISGITYKYVSSNWKYIAYIKICQYRKIKIRNGKRRKCNNFSSKINNKLNSKFTI